MSWIDDPWMGFDTETTGVRALKDRLVTAALVLRIDGASYRSGVSAPDQVATWLTDPRHTLTTAPAESPAATVSDFTASYLAHRAAEREHGPDTHTASPSAWGPVTDSSPDLW